MEIWSGQDLETDKSLNGMEYESAYSLHRNIAKTTAYLTQLRRLLRSITSRVCELRFETKNSANVRYDARNTLIT